MTNVESLPTRLSPEAQRELDAALEGCRARTLVEVGQLLGDVKRPELQQLCYELAFRPGEVLPKRRTRPQVTPVHLCEQVHLAHRGPEHALQPLRRFVILVQEYYDLLDDLVDGDVAPGHEVQVMLVSQLLLPLMVRTLERVHPEAVDYWSGRCQTMVESLYVEKCETRSWDNYLRCIEHQSLLYGVCTGLAALAAGADSRQVDSAERLGCLAYCFSQLVLDLEQADTDGDDNWNALQFRSTVDVTQHLRAWSEEIHTAVSAFAAPHDRLLWGLYAVDVDALAERVNRRRSQSGSHAPSSTHLPSTHSSGIRPS